MSVNKLDLKIRQLHEALDGLEADVSSVKAEHGATPERYYLHIDFSQEKSDAELANVASLLIANIASMKDHLKAWCRNSGKSFEGDTLIDSNKGVAIVHDLWNLDKHAELNSRPRSGHHPQVVDLKQRLVLSTGAGADSFAAVTIDPTTRQLIHATKGGGSAGLLITGRVIDEKGNDLGDFSEICEQATDAWEQALRSAGVAVPTR